MADVSIANLPAFVGAGVAANDLFVMVDVDDTSESPLGTTKRGTFAQITSSIPGNVIIGGTLQVNGQATFFGRIIANNGLQFTAPATLAALEISTWSFENPVTRFYIGDGTGYGLRFSRRVGSVTTDVFALSDTGVLVVNGSATFNSDVAIGGTLGVTGPATFGNANFANVGVSGGITTTLVQTFRIAPNSDAAGVQWTNNAQVSEWMRLFATGLTVNGTINASGLITGDQGMRIPNGKFYQGVRFAGAAPINLLGFDTGTNDLTTVLTGQWVLRDTGNTPLITFTGAGAGIFTDRVTAVGFVATAETIIPGSMNFNAVYGLRLQGRAGSTHDFAITNPAFNSLILSVPTGTSDVVFNNTITVPTSVITAQVILPNNGYVQGKTTAAVQVVVIGVDPADHVIIDNSALGVRMNGSLAVAQGLTVTAGGFVVVAGGADITGPVSFPSYGGGTHAMSAGNADSGGVGFRVLRVPN